MKEKKLLKKRRVEKERQEAAAILAEAKLVADKNGLQVNWDESSCPTCQRDLSRIIVENQDKGLIFYKLYKSAFHNCGGELEGDSAVYEGKTYAVVEGRGDVVCIDNDMDEKSASQK